ncbi:hypothetical protein NM208_g8682 [Fusarium decemcellulare]|uniref:Uncharacterized protein n=1 Tax=Fusarium decemcellulare TaxID=57161 RepID=A0ACC1S4E1_9HYPO|nr:hypothetical protein NM208_g8682 [Fusarium decemcellulare]
MDLQTPEPTLRPDDIVIAVMGVTGAGKSTFIERVTGQNVGVGHTLVSHTIAVSIYAYQLSVDRCVYLVDTPGFDDTSRTDTEVLKEVAFFLSQIYRKDVKLAGIIYLHRITDNRVSGSALKNLKMFQQLCGDEAFGHVILATSMWDTLDQSLKELGVKREKELVTKAEFWGTMHKSGSQVARWSGNEESAKSIVGKIVDIHDKSGKLVLKIQDELVNGNMTLDETAAGKEVQREILAAKAELQDEIQQLREMQEEMIQHSNDKLVKELASQQEAFERQLNDANHAQESLKISLESLLNQKSAEYEQLLTGARDEQRRLADALAQKEAEYERARRARSEDEKMFREAREHFTAEVEALKRRIEEKEKARAEAKRKQRAAEEKRKAEEEERKAKEAEEQQRKLKEEMQSVLELQEELRRQQREEQEAAARRHRAIQAQMESQRQRKQSKQEAMGLLGVIAGVGTAAVGFMTLNPGLVSVGASIASGSASNMS